MRLSDVRVLVTGGAGFIGSHLVEDLVHQGATVRVLDNFSSGDVANLAKVRNDVEIMEADVLDADAVHSAMRGCEIVSHQAAQLEITRGIEDPIYDLRMNTEATLNVFQAAVKTGVSRVIYASSACVYGQAEYTPSDEAKHPTNPNWDYGVSKLACEKYAAIFSERYGLPMTGLRYAIIYGPREWYGRVLTIFLKRVLDGEPPVVFGDGAQTRDFTFVGDLVRLHSAIIAQDVPRHEIFNISTGLATTIKDLASLVLEITELPTKVIHEDVQPGEHSQIVSENRMRLPSELQTMVLDPTKAKVRLGWQPQITLREGIKAEWQWLKENRHRWQTMSY
jgi:UDP-glucose 4-epimerase